MKTKIATALSVIGVLGAGSAAALVNTQILDGGPAESGASAAVLPPASSVDVTIPELTPPTTEPAPATTAPTEPTPGSSVATTMPAPSEFLTAFNVGGAGVVTVDVIDGRIVLVSAEPKGGWAVSEAEENDDHVDVEFRSATVRVEFEAAFIDGRIVPEVESYAIGGTTPTGGAAPATTLPTSTFDDDDRSDDADSSGDESDDDESDSSGVGDSYDDDESATSGGDDSESSGDDDESEDRDDD